VLHNLQDVDLSAYSLVVGNVYDLAFLKDLHSHTSLGEDVLGNLDLAKSSFANGLPNDVLAYFGFMRFQCFLLSFVVQASFAVLILFQLTITYLLHLFNL